MTRYVAEEGSELGHSCCFNGTVLDTARKQHNGRDAVVCECWDVDTAQRIAAALNAAAAAGMPVPE